MAEMHAYRKSVYSTMLAKSIFYGSSFIALWLANQILDKAEYGHYVLAVSLMWFLSVAASLGLDQTLLVRVARIQSGQAKSNLLSTALVTTVCAGSLGAAGLMVMADPLAKLLGLSGVGPWFAMLAVTVPLIGIAALFESWYIARGDTWRGQLYPALGHAVRVPLFAIAFLTDGGMAWIVVAEILVAVVPICLFLADRTRPGFLRPHTPTREEMTFGSQLLLSRLTNEGTRRIDVFMLGAVGTAVAVADYHVAARLVVLLDLGRELLQPAFIKRAGNLLALGSKEAAQDEYDAVRGTSLLISLVIACGLLLLGAPFLTLIGDFSSAIPAFMVLIGGGLINAAFGPSWNILKLANQPTRLLAIRLTMLAALIAGNIVLIPMMGALGAALTSLAAATLANVLLWRTMAKVEGLALIDGLTLLILVPALAAILLVAFDLMAPVFGAAALVVLTIGYVCASPVSWSAALAALIPARSR
ncbi:MAG: lipopolysaccharide biosynthesis protein [Sphingomonadaceae bacterium]